ncbi:hypothetical protein ALO43_200203 [Pseudomonas tremae]|uniref:Uncharacterized protein n=1 Tax=Pseudomonas tremae TaxID=200454 RepID=A0AA40TV96_9PSED|nr:hypothetical protein ALO43_200203 [Pseudomonas tremae]RMO07907.1 hypothetical protein ALQ48_03096 [Pseudomonas coronafaciens pv. zizaniae]
MAQANETITAKLVASLSKRVTMRLFSFSQPASQPAKHAIDDVVLPIFWANQTGAEIPAWVCASCCAMEWLAASDNGRSTREVLQRRPGCVGEFIPLCYLCHLALIAVYFTENRIYWFTYIA